MWFVVLLQSDSGKTNSMRQYPTTPAALPSPQNKSPAYRSYSRRSAYPPRNKSPHRPPPSSAPRHWSSTPPSPRAPARSRYADASPPPHAPPLAGSLIHASPAEYSPPSTSPSSSDSKSARPASRPSNAIACTPPTQSPASRRPEPPHSPAQEPKHPAKPAAGPQIHDDP